MSHPENPPPYSAGPQQSANQTRVQLQPVVTGQPGGHVTTVQVVTGGPMKSWPTIVICHSCNLQILTKTESRPGKRTHLWALCCFVTGLWPCIWMPYCTPDCMYVTHTCPSCNAYIGSY